MSTLNCASKGQGGKGRLGILGQEHVEEMWANNALVFSLPGSSEFYFTHIWPLLFFFSGLDA